MTIAPDGATVCDAAVIGGGWAGIAAAIALVESGLAVTLFEAAPMLGGRGRGIGLKVDGQVLDLDNGQHLMIGAYDECLRLARRVCGIDHGDPPALRRHRMQLRASDGLRIVAPGLPAPLHLVTALACARGLRLTERLAVLAAMLRLRHDGWRARSGETVTAMLERLRQPATLQHRFWNPLTVSALNTPAPIACAATFAIVLRDMLGATSAASDFLLPRTTLSAVLPAPATEWLRAKGCRIAVGNPVRSLEATARGWALRADSGTHHAAGLVLATSSIVGARLLAPVARTAAQRRAIDAIAGIAQARIATVYLGWRDLPVDALPLCTMLSENPDADAPGQWLFDRGNQHGWRIAAVVISAPTDRLTDDPVALASSAARQCTIQLGLPPPAWCRAVIERRASFACTPDREKPVPGTLAATGAPFERLMLAGDYAWPDYPATLEGAARSGTLAGRSLATALARPH